MALILPQIKAPNIIQTASKVSQSQNWTPMRGQICKPIDTLVASLSLEPWSGPLGALLFGNRSE